MNRPTLLGLSGSLRAEAHSTAILHSLAERMPSGIVLQIHDYSDLPLYNQDIDGADAPFAVKALRDAIGRADGLVIVTPEYNYGLPGVLKNALDWASRPYGEGSLTGKPVVTMSNSPAFTGGVRALSQLHETLLATQSLIVPRFQTVIGEVHKKIENDRLIDEPSLAFALSAIDDLCALIGKSARLAA